MLKARDSMKKIDKQKADFDQGQPRDTDFLGPILRKLNYKSTEPDKGGKVEPLPEEAAIAVKNEALRSLKERLLTRAEIIQRRLE